MPGFLHGLTTGIVGAIVGFVFFAVLGTLPASLELMAIYAVAGAATIGVIDAMPFWSTGYLIGWLIGNFLMFKDGVVDISEIGIYLFSGIIVLVGRRW